MLTTEIEIAGKSYTVQELPRQKNKAWRASFEEQVGAIITPVIEMAQRADDEKLSGELVSKLVAAIGGALAEGGDAATKLLLEYSPAMADDADHIRDEARDSEVVDAIVKVAQLAYPFGNIRKAMAGLRLPG